MSLKRFLLQLLIYSLKSHLELFSIPQKKYNNVDLLQFVSSIISHKKNRHMPSPDSESLKAFKCYYSLFVCTVQC